MLGIISDVHGNYPALKAVLSELDMYKCETILSLGDIVGYYCMPNECINELRKRKVIHILGNHDSYYLNNIICNRSTVVNQCLEYQKKIITIENRNWLKNSILYYENEILFACHGGWNNFLEEYVSWFDFEYVRNKSQKIFITGHTHKQKILKQDGTVYFNPGSVGQPRDYNCNAAFAIIKDDLNVLLKRAKYNINEITQKMQECGFEERIYSCLYYGTSIGEK